MLSKLCLAFDKQLESKGGCREDRIIPTDSNNSCLKLKQSHSLISVEVLHQVFHSKTG